MKKRIIYILWIIFLCAGLLNPMQINAITKLDVDQKCTLDITYAKGDLAFKNLDIQIYRVAEAYEDGTFELIEPYSTYPVNIHGITSQQEWKDVATTLNSYILSEQVKPYQKGKTDDNGRICFDELDTGLYLVSKVTTKNNNRTYVFENFMVYLPSFTNSDHFDYNVVVKPKCSDFIEKEDQINYQVIKLWKDSANSKIRPKSVEIDILKNGSIYDTVILDKNNNWSYTWTAEDDSEQYTVVEKNVPEEYKVSVSLNKTTFIITNTLPSKPNKNPNTGDTTSSLFYVYSMCISGILLVILGIRILNGESNEKNR